MQVALMSQQKTDQLKTNTLFDDPEDGSRGKDRHHKEFKKAALLDLQCRLIPRIIFTQQLRYLFQAWI